jgi:RNA 3'-terminal phosphate cyclase (ATP)
MIKIDGSFGEGGGQILRTALSLAAILKIPVTIENIRKGRKKPGLQPQHLTGVRAVASICGGKLTGDALYSDKLIFEPGEIVSGTYKFDISTAGSVTMVLQQTLPVLLFGTNTSNLTIKGGTNVAWSPPVEFINYVFLPILGKMGINCLFETQKWGFFPKGGGMIKAKIDPIKAPLNSINIIERGNLKRILGLATVANLPESIGEREIKLAKKAIDEKGYLNLSQWEIKTVPSLGHGNSFFIMAEYENCLAGFSALGEPGKPAERVAEEAVEDFIKFEKSNFAIEKHLSDQLLLYMALASGLSQITVPEITRHAKTSIFVIEQFLPVKFETSGNLISVEVS